MFEARGKKPLTPVKKQTANITRSVPLLAFLALVVLAAVLLANSMTKEVGRDEQMYCTAGALLGQGQMIYRDFSYPSQLPYHPLLLAALYRGFGTTQYLLVGRLVSVVCDVLVLVFILLIYRAIFGPRRLEGLLFGLAAVALYVFNPLVDYAAGYAWNHDVVILCVMASLWLFVTTDFEKRPRLWRLAVMGALLTLATFTRVTTALVEALFLVVILFMAGGSPRNRLRTALPFCVAALLAAIWPLWVIAQAPHAFWLNLVRIPTLYGRWLHEIGIVHSKLGLTMAAILTPAYLLLLIIAGYLIWVERRCLSRSITEDRKKMGLVAFLPLVFLLIAYIPPTMWEQYLAVPVPFITIAFAYPLARLCHSKGRATDMNRYRIAWCLVGIGVAVATLAYALDDRVALRGRLDRFRSGRWVPTVLHEWSTSIATNLPQPKLLLTLGPLQALEGGSDIYPELSCGSIVYRVGDLLSAQERQVTHTVGLKTLSELVRVRSPSGVIVGIEPSYFAFLEEPLRKLVPVDWRRDTYADTLQVYRRP